MSKNEIAVLEKKEISPIESKVEKLSITDAKGMKDAAEYLSQANKALDKIVAYKESKTKPLNQALKIIRNETRPFEDRLETMIMMLRKKMSIFQTEQLSIAQEKKDKIADRVGEGKGKLKAETAMQKMDEVDTPAAAITADSGAVKFRTVKKFEVTDFKALPDIYKQVFEPAIKEAMKNGVAIPGVRYFEVQEPVNFR